jgi:hypothetical protein
MRILLHIGMTKAGSSALQAGLFDLRRQLIKGEVLYPAGGRGRGSHTLLVHGLVPPQRLPRWLRQAYGGDTKALGQDANAWLSGLEKQIDTICPKTLILSEEFLFLVVDDDALTKLHNRLRGLGETVEVIAYVRRPSEHYLSSVQQLLKASDRIKGPSPILYRPTLDGYAKHVADRMHVIRYDRSDWASGDILRHFLATFIPEARIDGLGPPQQINSALSAEAMSVLAEYRRRIWPDGHNRFTPDTNRLVRALTAGDMEVPGDRRPHLHEAVARTVDQSSTDLLWLRDQYGITFNGIDYDDFHAATQTRPLLERLEEICAVDATRRNDLTLRVLYHLAKDGSRDDATDVGSALPVASRSAMPWIRSVTRRIVAVLRDHGFRSSTAGNRRGLATRSPSGCGVQLRGSVEDRWMHPLHVVRIGSRQLRRRHQRAHGTVGGPPR